MALTGEPGASRDSGLPVFNEVPGYLELCTPAALRDTPDLFHRFFLAARERYERTPPHGGYEVLRRMCDLPRRETFVVTSNVDGALQKAGLNPVEIHGSVRQWQCSLPCTQGLFEPSGDAPSCPQCGRAARPNVLLFDDCAWIANDAADKVAAFVARTKKAMAAQPALRLACLEIGCADRVPTMRCFSEDLLSQLFASGAAFEDARAAQPQPRATLVRVNPDAAMAGIVRESGKHLVPLLVSLPMGARDALEAINVAGGSG